MNQVYIFAYGSLMKKEDAERTLDRRIEDEDMFSAFLEHYARSWNAISDNLSPTFKWLIHRATGERPHWVSYLNLRFQQGALSQGILIKINSHELEAFDRRELGYKRVNVSLSILSEKTLTLPVYIYISQKTLVRPYSAALSADYMNLVRKACVKANDSYPGLLDNYLNETPLPEATVTGLDVVFFNDEFTELFELRLDAGSAKTIIASVCPIKNSLVPEREWLKHIQTLMLGEQDWRVRFLAASLETNKNNFKFSKDVCFLVQLAWYSQQDTDEPIEASIIKLNNQGSP